jgi:arginine exporter protein ArgO
VTNALISGLLAGYGIAIPVGAIAVLIAGLAARTSFAVGAGAGLGTATADAIYAIAAVLGGAALAQVIQPFATPLRWAAVAVLVVIAVRSAVTALRHHRDRVAAPPSGAGIATPRRAYGVVLGLTLLNPMTIVYFGALVLGGQAAGGSGQPGGAPSAVTAAVFVLAAFAASASWQLLIAGGGAALGRVVTGERGRLVTALVSSAVIVVLAVRLALTR